MELTKEQRDILIDKIKNMYAQLDNVMLEIAKSDIKKGKK